MHTFGTVYESPMICSHYGRLYAPAGQQLSHPQQVPHVLSTHVPSQTLYEAPQHEFPPEAGPFVPGTKVLISVHFPAM
jgi:hypothetical protein